MKYLGHLLLSRAFSFVPIDNPLREEIDTYLGGTTMRRLDPIAPTWVHELTQQAILDSKLPAHEFFNRTNREATPLRDKLFYYIYQGMRHPSYAQIGRWFNRDHTSIIAAIKRHEAKRMAHSIIEETIPSHRQTR